MTIQFAARNCFFFGAFEKGTEIFVAQIYVGPVNWELPEFQIGYFVDRDHEGRGYTTEAMKGAHCLSTQASVEGRDEDM